MNSSTGIPILDLLIRHEEAARNLYKTCALEFPALANFWETLVREEQAHTEVLVALAKQLLSENVFLSDRKFNATAVSTSIAHVDKQRQRVETGDMTFLQALATTLDIERAMVEKSFFDVFETDTLAMKDEFAALRRHSREHATRIETKLNQWKNEQEAPRMELKNKIIDAQRKIVDTLTECEINIGRLYEKYAARFPEKNDLWITLSKVEETHANLLKTMHRIFDKGNIFYNLGKFGDAAIQPTITLIDRSLKEAEAPGFKAADALKTALNIESSILDAHFYDIVDSDAPEFKIIAARLSSETKHHAELIRHHFEKYIEDSGLKA